MSEPDQEKIARLEADLREWESGNWESERAQNIRHDRARRIAQLQSEVAALKKRLRDAQAETAEARKLLAADEPDRQTLIRQKRHMALTLTFIGRPNSMTADEATTAARRTMREVKAMEEE